ncbi:unnamed protein product [Rhodiola kirilowii]
MSAAALNQHRHHNTNSHSNKVTAEEIDSMAPEWNLKTVHLWRTFTILAQINCSSGELNA